MAERVRLDVKGKRVSLTKTAVCLAVRELCLDTTVIVGIPAQDLVNWFVSHFSGTFESESVFLRLDWAEEILNPFSVSSRKSVSVFLLGVQSLSNQTPRSILESIKELLLKTPYCVRIKDKDVFV